MPRFSANISMLFTEHALPDRFQAAANAGFKAVEIQFPYPFPAEELAKRREAAGVEVVLINFPAGDMAAGDRGIACLPEREAEFRKGVSWAAEYAEALKVPRVNTLAGLVAADADREDALYSLAYSISFAAKEMAKDDIEVLLEPVNDQTVPGYLVNTTDEGIAALDRAGHPNLKLQADIFHMASMGEDIEAQLTKLAPRIGHIQFADHPGRHEPGTGTLDLAAIFAAIDKSGYDGWVGAEYAPAGKTADGLGWLKDFA